MSTRRQRRYLVQVEIEADCLEDARDLLATFSDMVAVRPAPVEERRRGMLFEAGLVFCERDAHERHGD